MSSVEEATLERVSEGHISKSEKEFPANVKEKDDEAGDLFELDDSLTRSSGPPDYVGEGKDNFIVKTEGDENDEDVNRGSSAESGPILVKEAKVGADGSQPEGNDVAGGIGKLTTKDDTTPAEDSTEEEASTSAGQGTILNGILSLVGLGNSKPAVAEAVAEDGNSDSTAALTETDHRKESNRISGVQNDRKELESSELKKPHDSKDAGLDDFELLSVKSGGSMDDFGQSITMLASESRVPSQETVASKLVDSEPLGKQIAANDNHSDKPADAAEVGEIGHGQHKSNATEISSMESADDKATTAPEAPKTEEVAPSGKTGLLELVGGGVLSLIGLGGAKHAAETPGEDESRVDGETHQCSEADTEISKDEASFELVDKPSEDNIELGGITGFDTLAAVDAADDDEGNPGQVAVRETPKSTSDSSVEAADGAHQETSSIVSNGGGYSGNKISVKESAAENGKHIDFPKDVEESMVAAGSAEGDPRSVEVRNDSKGAGVAKKAIKGDLKDLQTGQTYSGEAGEAGKGRSDSYGNENYCSPDSGKPSHPGIAAVNTNESGGPGGVIAVRTDSNQNVVDKTNQQEENVHRGALFGANGEVDAFKTVSQSPKTDEEERGRRHDSDLLDAERNYLPSEPNFAQESIDAVRIDSERSTLADTSSSEAIHTKEFLADQDQPLGPEVTKEDPAEDETFQIVDPSRAEGTELPSAQEPNGVAEAFKEQDTKDADLNGHVKDFAEFADGDHGTDNLRRQLPLKDEALSKAASQQGEPDPLKKLDKNLDDDQSLTYNASDVLAQEHPAIDQSDSKTRSIFGVTLKRVESLNRTPARELDSHTKDEVPIGKSSDRIGDSPASGNQTSSVSDVVDSANPNEMDVNAALANGDTEHAEQIHPRGPDENKEQDEIEATQQQQQGKGGSSKDEPNENGMLVSEGASQEKKFEPPHFSTVKKPNEPVDPSLSLVDNAMAQADLETDADSLPGGFNVSSNEMPSAKENVFEKQAATPSSGLTNQADMSIYAPKHEDDVAVEDVPPTTPQSLNESRSTTPPETPFAQLPEHLEQKHPPSPADDQSASQSPIASTLPVGVQTREWSAPGKQSREVAAKTSSSEPVKATDAFVRPENYETSTAQPEKGTPASISGKPTVKRSRSKSGVAKLKVCFTGCSSVEK